MPKPKIHLATVQYAHDLTRDAFMAGVNWILEALKHSHMLEMNEQFENEIHKAAMEVIKRYQQVVEESLGLKK